MRIYILGYMYSGKSTLGKKLASHMGYEFIDTDNAFAKKYHILISDFFKKYDEKAFRALEKDILLSTKEVNNMVISLGGGTPCSDENMEFIKSSGLSIYLKAEPDLILSRIRNSQKSRPMLENVPSENLTGFITEHIKQRSLFYNQADIIYSAENVRVSEVKAAIHLFLNKATENI